MKCQCHLLTKGCAWAIDASSDMLCPQPRAFQLLQMSSAIQRCNRSLELASLFTKLRLLRRLASCPLPPTCSLIIETGTIWIRLALQCLLAPRLGCLRSNRCFVGRMAFGQYPESWRGYKRPCRAWKGAGGLAQKLGLCQTAGVASTCKQYLVPL